MRPAGPTHLRPTGLRASPPDTPRRHPARTSVCQSSCNTTLKKRANLQFADPMLHPKFRDSLNFAATGVSAPGHPPPPPNIPTTTTVSSAVLAGCSTCSCFSSCSYTYFASTPRLRRRRRRRRCAKPAQGKILSKSTTEIRYLTSLQTAHRPASKFMLVLCDTSN